MADSPKRQRVAIVYHFFPHYRGPVMRELLSHGRHHYQLFGEVRDPLGTGVKAMEMDDTSRFTRLPTAFLGGTVLIQRGIIGLALRRDLDTIIYHGSFVYLTTWISAALARITGKRVLFWTIGWHQPETGLRNLARCTFYRLAHALLLYGHDAKTTAIANGFDASRLHVVNNSLDYARQRAVRESVTPEQIRGVRDEWFPDANLPMLICTTRLVPKRRLDVLFDAMVRLREEDHEVCLLLVGDGPERQRLEGLADALALRVRFFGACYDEATLGRLIMAANVTVAPGMVGLAAMHSLVYGTPVVTHQDPNRQAPEAEAIIDDVNGSLYIHGDLNDLVQAIRRWTTTPMPDEASRPRCHELIDRFYTPVFQRNVIDRAVDGRPADDLFFQREPVV